MSHQVTRWLCGGGTYHESAEAAELREAREALQRFCGGYLPADSISAGTLERHAEELLPLLTRLAKAKAAAG